jgi:hypothetical protein
VAALFVQAAWLLLGHFVLTVAIAVFIVCYINNSTVTFNILSRLPGAVQFDGSVVPSSYQRSNRVT